MSYKYYIVFPLKHSFLTSNLNAFPVPFTIPLKNIKQSPNTKHALDLIEKIRKGKLALFAILKIS